MSGTQVAAVSDGVGTTSLDEPPTPDASKADERLEGSSSGSNFSRPNIVIPGAPNRQLCVSPAVAGTPSFAQTPQRKKPQKYKNSVGGHHLLLSLGDGKILKECARREEKFYLAYERAMSASSAVSRAPLVEPSHPLAGASPSESSLAVGAPSEKSSLAATPATPFAAQPKALVGFGMDDVLLCLAPFIPRYYGSQFLPECELEELAESTTNDYSYFRPLRMLQIQDVTYGYERPCVLDLKMGTRQYGLNAPDRKVESKTRKARESTSEKLGCRMSGWQKWVASEGRMVKVDKYQCRGYTTDEFTNALRSFLNYDPTLMHRFKLQIDAMKDIFNEQNALRFYTSSLLLVYDAMRPVETARVYMVDFAYCYSMDEVRATKDIAGYALRDEGYLLGLRTLSHTLAPSYPSATPIPLSCTCGSQPHTPSAGLSPCGQAGAASAASFPARASIDSSDEDLSARAT